MAAQVVKFKPALVKPRARQRSVPKTALDPRKDVEGRVYELTMCHATAENVVEKRFRVRLDKGRLEDHIYWLKDKETACYFGMVSEQLHNGKWTPYGWGWVPVTLDPVVRELVPETKAVPEIENENV